VAPARLLGGVSPWIRVKIRSVGQPAPGGVRVPASAGDTGPRVSHYWGLGSLRTGADVSSRLGSGARSEGHMKHVLLDVMADQGVRLPSRAAHVHTFTPTA
jgi:hypothetical protein